MCCSLHCAVMCSDHAKTAWFPLGLPELLYWLCVRLCRKSSQLARIAVYTVTAENIVDGVLAVTSPVK